MIKGPHSKPRGDLANGFLRLTVADLQLSHVGVASLDWMSAPDGCETETKNWDLRHETVENVLLCGVVNTPTWP